MQALSPSLLYGQQSLLVKLRQALTGALNADASVQSAGVSVISDVDALMSDAEPSWDAVRKTFSEDFRTFEKLLYKLHFKRQRKLNELARRNVQTFLAIGYLYTNDVRYFNEFLHFGGEGSEYWLLMVEVFFSNLNENQKHHFPLSSIDNMKTFVDEAEAKLKVYEKAKPDTSLKIGLLGSPTFFKEVRRTLLEAGFEVSCYFVPYHPDKKINFVLRNPLAFALFRFLKGIRFGFKTLSKDHKSSAIYESLKDEKLDIGFHKLGFIIKSNIIRPFSTGLINDHWAALPFVRGLSTIQYSVLLGAPLAATAHLAEVSIDSGGIIKMYRYDDAVKQYSTISELRNHIRRDRDFRAIDSIITLAKTGKPLIENPADNGLMFYSMHPMLEAFIEANILQGKG